MPWIEYFSVQLIHKQHRKSAFLGLTQMQVTNNNTQMDFPFIMPNVCVRKILCEWKRLRILNKNQNNGSFFLFKLSKASLIIITVVVCVQNVYMNSVIYTTYYFVNTSIMALGDENEINWMILIKFYWFLLLWHIFKI